ncbi:MAG: AI-2E family transporter [Chloroflexi bacterium]|nr:AI-2E family transporter [Chloroflexota bacterium]
MTDRELRRKRFLMLSAAALYGAAVVLLYLLGSVLITVFFSALIAYALLPLANVITRPMPWRESRPELSRSIAVGFIFVVAIGIFVGSMALVIPPTIEQSEKFIEDLPTFFNAARSTIEGWLGDYSDLVPDDVRGQVEENLANMGSLVVTAAWDVLPNAFGLVSGTFALIIGLATMPMLIFYMVKDSSDIGSAMLAPFPKPLQPYLIKLARIADRTLGGYLRGQLILASTIGVVVTIGLVALGVPFAFLLGVVAGFTALIPIVGPFIGGAVAMLVTLATAPEKLLWVLALYVVVQLAENTLLAPRVQAGALNIHPIVVILVIIVGGHFFGIWGIIFGAPVVSMARDVVRYVAHEWDQPPDAPHLAEQGENDLADDAALT